MTRAEIKAEFERFAAHLAQAYPPIIVRQGDEPNSLIVENFPQPVVPYFKIKFGGPHCDVQALKESM